MKLQSAAMEPIRRWATATALALFSTAWLAMANNGLSWGGEALSLPLRFVPFLLGAAFALHLLRDRSRPPAPEEAAAVLGAVLVGYILSDYGAWKWFFWIGPDHRNLLLLLALVFGGLFASRPRPLPPAAVLAVLVAAQTLLTWQFLDGTGGLPLQRDDHPSFLYRLSILRETYPQIVSYDPWWNGGRVATELLQTGILTVTPFFLPLAKLLPSVPTEKLYTPFLAILFLWGLPWLFVVALRQFGADRATALWAGVLSLYPNRYFFINLLVWGVFPSLIAMALVVPAAGALYALTVRRRGGWAAVLTLSLSLTLASFWPAAFFTFLPLALVAPFALRRLDRRRWGLLAAAALIFLALVSPWLVSFLASGELASFDAIGAAPAAAPDWDNVRNSLEHLSYLSPLLLLFGLPGVLVLGDRPLRRWIAVFTVVYLLLLGFGNEYKSQYQFLRIVNSVSYVMIVPAAFWIGRVFSFERRRDAPVRGLLLASIVVTILSAGWIWSNRGHERYTLPGRLESDLVSLIKEEVPPSARLFWAGKTMHGFGSGHVAPLPALTGRMMMASDFYHFHIKEIGGTYDLVPRFYLKGEGSTAKTERWLGLFNVSHVATVEGKWVKYFSSHPELYENIFDHRDGDFWLQVYRRRNFTDSLFEKGSGDVEVLPGRIRVRLDDPSREAVLRFNWIEDLASEPPVTLSAYGLPGSVDLLRVDPGGVGTFEIFRPRWW